MSSSNGGSKRELPDLTVAPVRPLEESELPRCSIVILNWNGRHHLAGCFESLAALDYPKDRVEVILVDNASTDGSQKEVREKHGWVRLIENERNVGFSAGCNQGAREARDADLLVFLNNDIRVEPAFLRELVAPIVRGTCALTTARMYSWDGKVMNSAGGGMNFHGLGIQRGYMDAPGAEFEVPRATLFACGGAMAIDAEVFDDIGGFDEEFFAYYEDVDLGWRAWVLGHEVHYVPGAVCYHHHSSTSARVPVERLRLLQVRNPLLACFKNYDDERLRQVLPAMLALATRRAFLSSGIGDLGAYRIEHLANLREPGLVAKVRERLTGGGSSESVNRVAVADLIAINDLLGRWDHWMQRRQAVQSRRKRSDEDIFRLFLRPMWCIEDEEGYRELHEGTANFLGIDALFEGLTTMEKDPPR
ncbi:MAG: glycosyltransferase family 2 protein [bacterium]|nr:glycosyltransferase family 2 protein [bacterium]